MHTVKNNPIVVIFLFSALVVYSAKAQENVAKLHLGSLTMGKVNLGYERVIQPNQSFAVNMGYMSPREIPFVNMVEFVLETSNSFESRVEGFSFVPEYRFYTKASQNRQAPRGAYFALYLMYSRYAGEFKAPKGDYEFYLEGTMSTIGAGSQLGVSWLIGDRISLDFYLIGFGLSRNMIRGDYATSDPEVNYQEVANDINTYILDLMIGNKNFSVEGKEECISIESKMILPALRFGFAIGVAF